MTVVRGIIRVVIAGLLFVILNVPAQGREADLLEEEISELGLFLDVEQLVETATRHPKPISQVAENVTVVTAEEIAAMRAHTVAEVLNRVPGLIIDGSYTDFGSRSTIFIQGSDYEHVLVLVDGMRWSYVSFDYAETNTIPVQIIKRIEIVKGPASSTWGSSLGGVVNIITKDTGGESTPSGTLSASYGERDTSDLRGDGAGKTGPLGYYLYAGYQHSDGLRDSRFFDNESVYGKFSLELPRDMKVRLSGGYSRPEYVYYHLAEYDDQGVIDDRVWHAALDFSAPLSESLTFYLGGYRFDDTLKDSWQFISSGRSYNLLEYEGEAIGANARLVWKGGQQTIVLGAETENRKNISRDLLARYQAPESSEDVLAFFINNTIRLDRLTVTPGLRYDHLSLTDDELSPSIGLTYMLTDTTLFRGNVSRGFRKPYPSLLSGDPHFFISNPQLESEIIWSYQVGLETTAVPFLYLKTSLFSHRASEVWARDQATWVLTNNGDYDRKGVEAALKTAVFHNFSLGASGMYLRLEPDLTPAGTHYSANLLIDYTDDRWQAQLYGHYLKLGDVSPPSTHEEETDTFIWDLMVSREINLREGLAMELFAVLHNIFSEEQFSDSYIPNTMRWFEAGLQVTF